MARRSAVPTTPKVSGLAEALRSVGRVLDAKEGQARQDNGRPEQNRV
jgi:hypothetical protein